MAKPKQVPIAVFEQRIRFGAKQWLQIVLIATLFEVFHIIQNEVHHLPLADWELFFWLGPFPLINWFALKLMRSPLRIFPDHMDYKPIVGLTYRSVKVSAISEVVVKRNSVFYKRGKYGDIVPLYGGDHAAGVVSTLRELLATRGVHFTEASEMAAVPPGGQPG